MVIISCLYTTCMYIMDFFDIAHSTRVSHFSFCWLRPEHHVQFDVFLCPPTFALKSPITIMYVWMVLSLSLSDFHIGHDQMYETYRSSRESKRKIREAILKISETNLKRNSKDQY